MIKNTFLMLLFGLSVNQAFCQVSKNSSSKPDVKKKLTTVEASCGQCSFGMKGESCDLAVKIDGKAYFVEGATIHEFGNPHDKNGFCLAVRQAEVQGEIVNNRFLSSYFKLLPIENSKK